MSTPLVNIISVQHLDPRSYPKVLDGYEMGSLDFSSNDLDVIYTDLALIDQRRRLTKTPPTMASAAVIFISDHKQQKKNPSERTSGYILLTFP